MTWEEVLRRDDIVGGDLETYETDHFYRGPIEEIILSDGAIFIICTWTATREARLSNSWERHEIKLFRVPVEHSNPHERENGTIHFTIPHMGRGTIHPCGTQKLDPRHVRGLLRLV